jgi:acyl carrier protein
VDHRTEVRQFVQQLLAQKGDGRSFSDGDSLVLSGRLQSVDAVEIVVFLEEKWGIDFAKIGFDASQIDCVDAIDALIRQAEISH